MEKQPTNAPARGTNTSHGTNITLSNYRIITGCPVRECCQKLQIVRNSLENIPLKDEIAK